MEKKNAADISEANLFRMIGEIAMQLEKAGSEEEIISVMAEKLHQHYQEIYIILSVITPLNNTYKILELKGLDKMRKRIETLLGMNILKMEFPLSNLSDDNIRLNSNGHLNLVEGGIHALALKMISKPVSKTLEKLLDIDKVYTMGMILDQHNFGNLTLFVRREFHLSPTDICLFEALSVILSIAMQRTRAYKQLHQDQEKTRRILEITPTGIGVLTDRVFQDVNERVCEITGYDKSELVGQSARILYLSKEEFERVGDMKNSLMKKTGTGEIETLWRCKDGSVKNILVRTAPINPADISEGDIFTALDITKRKEVEAALSESEERYRKLVDFAPMAIMIHRQGTIEYVNQTILDLIGLTSADQIIGTSALDLMHPDDRKGAMERIGRMYQTGQSAPIAEERFITSRGEVITLQVAATIIQYKGATASLVSALNVTDLKRAEKEISRYSTELEEINIAKDKFFSIIAHDLKGPFNSILGFSDILYTEYEDYSDEERRHFIKNIATSAQNTYRLLENLLEWSRAQTNRLDFRPEILELSSVINETLLLLRSQAEAKDIHLFSAVGFNTRVFADENMVKTIMRNLLSNAIKFSRKRGNVRIMERPAGSDEGKELIEILVKDDGVGMSPAIVEQLFHIDQMIKTPGTDNEKGTGLGLILCHELVLRNGGSIWAESEPDKGTTLHITLPKA